MSGRCKACDAVLSESEIIWDADISSFEDLCRRCRYSVSRDMQSDVLSQGGVVAHLEDITEDQV